MTRNFGPCNIRKKCIQIPSTAEMCIVRCANDDDHKEEPVSGRLVLHIAHLPHRVQAEGRDEGRRRMDMVKMLRRCTISLLFPQGFFGKRACSGFLAAVRFLLIFGQASAAWCLMVAVVCAALHLFLSGASKPKVGHCTQTKWTRCGVRCKCCCPVGYKGSRCGVNVMLDH